METAIFDAETTLEAAELLKRGEIVAFPTETVYGLGAALFNPSAIKKIFSVKKRPADNPLIAHISDLAQVEQLAVDIPPSFYALATSFFPGPLTVVLKRHPSVPDHVSGKLETIALRMPNHPVAQMLIRLVGEPLVAPSANLSGRPSSTTAAHVLEDFSGLIAGVIDGGSCQIGLESTVISLLNPQKPTLFRPGAISKGAIEEVLRQTVHLPSEGSLEPTVSPGMKYRHYAPKMPMRLFTSWEAFQMHLSRDPMLKRLVLSNRALDGLQQLPLLPESLYAALRFADHHAVGEIVSFCDEGVLKDPALMDRLTRAASHSEICGSGKATIADCEGVGSGHCSEREFV